jgi:hypothetical protein
LNSCKVAYLKNLNFSLIYSFSEADNLIGFG